MTAILQSDRKKQYCKAKPTYSQRPYWPNTVRQSDYKGVSSVPKTSEHVKDLTIKMATSTMVILSQKRQRLHRQSILQVILIVKIKFCLII